MLPVAPEAVVAPFERLKRSLEYDDPVVVLEEGPPCTYETRLNISLTRCCAWEFLTPWSRSHMRVCDRAAALPARSCSDCLRSVSPLNSADTLARADLCCHAPFEDRRSRRRSRLARLLCGGRDFDLLIQAGRTRRGLAEFAEGLQMTLDRFPNVPLRLFQRAPCCDASRQIGNVGGPIVLCLLKNHGIFLAHRF
jgi:hypothetical protein